MPRSTPKSEFTSSHGGTLLRMRNCRQNSRGKPGLCNIKVTTWTKRSVHYCPVVCCYQLVAMAALPEASVLLPSHTSLLEVSSEALIPFKLGSNFSFTSFLNSWFYHQSASNSCIHPKEHKQNREPKSLGFHDCLKGPKTPNQPHCCHEDSWGGGRRRPETRFQSG